MLSPGEIGGTEYQIRKSRWSARPDYTAWLLLGASIIESEPCSVGLHLVEARGSIVDEEQNLVMEGRFNVIAEIAYSRAKEPLYLKAQLPVRITRHETIHSVPIACS